MIEQITNLANSKRFKNLRKGQALMNALFIIDRDLYNKITGTDADPFYVDEKINKFWEEIERNNHG